MPFDKDGANTRRVLGTDNTGVELDGQVRNTVWDVGTTAWVRATPSVPSGATINITGTVNTVGGSGQATVNINGFPTVNLGSWPTLNVGNQVIVTGTVNTVGGSGTATVNINGSVILTATVNLGSIGTINVGNTVTVSGNVTATTTIASAPTMNVGNSVNLGTVPTVNVGNTVNVLGTATVNVGSALPAGANVIGTATVNVGAVITATVNIGTIPTVNIGSSFPTFNVGNNINLGTGATQATALFHQNRSLNTYTATYRLAARPYALSKAFTAGSRFQFATIHHPSTSTKTVKLKRVELALESSSAAAIIMADLVRITAAPATGNPAITPTPANPANPAVDSVCLALPTTAGTEGALHSMHEWNLGITGAASVVSPPPGLNWYTLWPQTQGASESLENQFPTIRAGVLEGFAVTLDGNAITTVKGYVVIEFTEE